MDENFKTMDEFLNALFALIARTATLPAEEVASELELQIMTLREQGDLD